MASRYDEGQGLRQVVKALPGRQRRLHTAPSRYERCYKRYRSLQKVLKDGTLENFRIARQLVVVNGTCSPGRLPCRNRVQWLATHLLFGAALPSQAAQGWPLEW